jgi:hypothetical protein
MSFCLGSNNQKGHLQYVSSIGIDAKQKLQVGVLRTKKTTTFLRPVRQARATRRVTSVPLGSLLVA